MPLPHQHHWPRCQSQQQELSRASQPPSNLQSKHLNMTSLPSNTINQFSPLQLYTKCALIVVAEHPVSMTACTALPSRTSTTKCHYPTERLSVVQRSPNCHSAGYIVVLCGFLSHSGSTPPHTWSTSKALSLKCLMFSNFGTHIFSVSRLTSTSQTDCNYCHYHCRNLAWSQNFASWQNITHG